MTVTVIMTPPAGRNADELLLDLERWFAANRPRGGVAASVEITESSRWTGRAFDLDAWGEKLALVFDEAADATRFAEFVGTYRRPPKLS